MHNLVPKHRQHTWRCHANSRGGSSTAAHNTATRQAMEKAAQFISACCLRLCSWVVGVRSGTMNQRHLLQQNASRATSARRPPMRCRPSLCEQWPLRLGAAIVALGRHIRMNGLSDLTAQSHTSLRMNAFVYHFLPPLGTIAIMPNVDSSNLAETFEETT